MATIELAQEIGYSANQFVSVKERQKNYEKFEQKSLRYLRRVDEGLKMGLELLPMEEEDGVDVVAFKLAKKILDLKPTSVKLDTDFVCFTVITENGKEYVRPALWFTRLLLHATDYICQTHCYSLMEFFISRVRNYLGIHDESYTWVFDGKSNEEKVIDLIKAKVIEGDTVEYMPGWYVSIIHKGTQHRPGLDGFNDFCINLPNTIDHDKMLKSLSDVYGEYEGHDEILFCYTWKA